MEKLTPSTVLVIGASGAIGAAICQPFARAGWKVGIHHHKTHSGAESTLRDVEKAGGVGKLYQADIRNSQQTTKMIEGFYADWGQIDVLVVAAGTTINQFVLRTSSQQWTDVLETNLTGVFFCLNAAGPILYTQKTGSILIVGSLSSMKGATGQAAYAASKAGLLGLVKTTAREWGDANIRINAFFPGWHQSPLSDEAFPELDELHDHVLHRTPNLSTVANMAYHIANLPDTSGQIFNMDSRIW